MRMHVNVGLSTLVCIGRDVFLYARDMPSPADSLYGPGSSAGGTDEIG